MTDAKNIVVCLDGTGNQIKAKGNTNVVRLHQLLDLADPERQVAYYDPGVGTFGSQGALTAFGSGVSKLFGLTFGYGVRDNLEEAYVYLMRTYRPGDRIYLFGFSRGAYTARALAALLHRGGLPRPGAENLAPYAVRYYARTKTNWKKEDWEQLQNYSNTFAQTVDGSHSVPIHFMGLWDSVRAGGIFRWNLKWPYTRQIPNVRTASHAVSINEKRRPYREYLVFPREGSDRPELTEVWFAGVHSDVGGTFEDDPRLSDISLKWMAEQAMSSGLLVDRKQYERRCALDKDYALGTVHEMGWVWALLTYRRRTITPGDAWVHESVRYKLDHDERFKANIPANARWADPHWTDLEP